MSVLEEIRTSNRMAAHTAAAVYAASALDGLVTGLLPGDPSLTTQQVGAIGGAFAVSLLLLAIGPRLPRMALAMLGPIGVGLIACSMASTSGSTDAAVMYAMPVLWMTMCFGRRGALVILACVAIAHAITLLVLPPASSYPGRWVDVMVACVSIAFVVLALEHRNEVLLQRLAGEARTDPLTGLLNRRGFNERAAIELAHANRSAGVLAAVIFDIDHFKHVNDEWGHDTGDLVIADFGRMISDNCREIDVVARMGGEEFTVLLPGCDTNGALAFLDHVRAALADSLNDLPQVRFSAGLAVAEHPESIELLLKSADLALYEAKRAGRNCTRVATLGATDPAACLVASRQLSVESTIVGARSWPSRW